MTALTPGRNQPNTDLVFTPDYLVDKLIEHYKPTGKILDPAKGAGAFYNKLQGEVDWCEISEGRDFLLYKGSADWIFTNPPWSKMRAFLNKSMTIAPDIMFLVTITHVVTKARLRDIVKAGYGLREFFCVDTPPVNWPQNGFQLAGVHIQKGYTGPIILSGRMGY